MKNRICFLTVSMLLSSFLCGQIPVSGRVTDVNGKGIASVPVTDGYNIVLTGPAGEYNITTSERARFVYISLPEKYEPVGNFYIPLNDKTENKFNFTLKSVPNQPSAFIHIGDTEESVYKDFVDAIKNYVANHKLAFIVFNGDICYEKGMNFHAAELTTEKLGIRAVYTLGNHDLVTGEYGEQMYEKLFGPVWYSFNVGGVHFVSAPVNYGDKVPSYKPADVYRWVKKDLDLLPAGTPVVYMNHHLYGYDSKFDFSSDSLDFNLGSYNLKGYLHAHYHANLYHRTPEGVVLFSSMSPNKGGIDHSASSFRVINFDKKGNLRSELKYSTLVKHISANIFETPDGKLKAVANIYDTGSEVVSADVLFEGESSPLKQSSSWSWEGFVKPSAGIAKEIEGARISVKFSDGSVVFKNITYPYYKNNRILWATGLGGNVFMTSPLIANGIAVVATIDDDTLKRASVQGIDINTGKTKWIFKTKNSVKNNLGIWENSVLAGDIAGNIYSIDLNSGSLLWEKQLRSEGIHPLYTNGLTVSNGVVFAGFGNRFSALKVADGEVLWIGNAWNGGVNTVASPVVEQKSGVVLASGYWLGRFAQDISTGKLLWQKKDDDTRICDNTPVVFDNLFFYTSPNFITVVNPVSGEELVKQKINYTINSNSKPLVTDKYFIVGTTDKGVAAFDRKNGYKEIWNFKSAPALLYTAPYTKDFQLTVESGVATDGECIYFGANDGFIYCLNITNGLFKWKIELGSPILGNIVIENNVLYCCDFGGNLWVIKL